MSTERLQRLRLRPRLYLIQRGPRPAYHVAPFSPVIVCDRRDVALIEAGWTGDEAWVWSAQRDKALGVSGGLLLERWMGLLVDYGGLVRGCTLPDGTHVGFHHRSNAPETWALFAGAVWWSERELDEPLRRLGITAASDDWTRGAIARSVQRADRDREDLHPKTARRRERAS